MWIVVNGKFTDPVQVFADIVCEIASGVANAAGYITTLSAKSIFFEEYPLESRLMYGSLLRIMQKSFLHEVSDEEKKSAAEGAVCMVCDIVLDMRRKDPARCTSLLLHENMTASKLMKEVILNTLTDEVMNRLILLRELCRDQIASKVYAFRMVMLRKKVLPGDIVCRICSHFKAEFRQHLKNAANAAVPMPPSTPAFMRFIWMENDD
jgi:hypothetical protein